MLTQNADAPCLPCADLLLKNFGCACFLRNIAGEITFFNEEFLKILPQRKNSVFGKNFKEIFDDSVLKDTEKTDAEAIFAKKTVTFEKTIKTKDEKESHFRISKTPIFGPKNNPEAFFVIFKNIDEEKKIEKFRNEFIETIAHDLKSPIIAQLNALKLLSNGGFGQMTPEQQNMLNLTKNSCEYIYKLAKNIAFSCSEEAGRAPHLGVFNISELIIETAQSFFSLAHEKNQTIEFDFDCAQKTFVFADELQIKRVISNFLTNAIKHGEIGCAIKVFLKKCENELEFHTENRGEPASKEDLSQIFQKYKRTKFSRMDKTGAGLGLYISKQIVDSHGGKIYANCTENGTWTFGFTLPTKGSEGFV